MSAPHSRPTAVRRMCRKSVTLSIIGTLALACLPVRVSSAAGSPAPVTFITSSPDAASGDIFITPTSGSGYSAGAEILSQDGHIVWFHPVPQGETAADFRAQTYRGRPVLTWWEGTGLGGLATGTDYIYDQHYQPLATVNAGNGLSADGHEFLITPQNTALILAYTTTVANLSSMGGPSNQTVINGVVQEIDIPTGKVLFQWNSADHVPFSQSEVPLPSSPSTPWDWFHVNAVHLDTDGNLLIDARNTWTTYKVNRSSGAVIWQLGGKASDFTLRAGPGQVLDGAGEIFAYQHDPEALGNDVYTLFDNDNGNAFTSASSAPPPLSYSRLVTVKLDERAHTATLLSSDRQPDGLSAPSQGNAQTTANGDVFVGWGSLPYFSEFGPEGQLLLYARFPQGVNSYRAYLLPWGTDATETVSHQGSSGAQGAFTVVFDSSFPGRGIVLFGSGPGCSGLVETATQDQGAGTTSHTVRVTGNDLPGTVGNNGIVPGATYWYEAATVDHSRTEVDNNNGKCYTVTIPVT